MPLISLTQNQVSEIDEIDFEAVIAVGNWSFNNSGYAVHYWRSSDGKRHTLCLHRFIFARILEDSIPPKFQIDHISAREQGRAARLDNRRQNLRLATRSQNQATKSDQRNSRSGHKGITFRDGKYDVRLRYQGKRLHLGRYADFEVAVAVYTYAHRTLWKEFTSEVDHISLPPLVTQEKIDQQIAALLKTKPSRA